MTSLMKSNAQPLEPQWGRGGGASGRVMAFSPMPNPGTDLAV